MVSESLEKRNARLNRPSIFTAERVCEKVEDKDSARVRRYCGTISRLQDGC